MKFYLSLLTLLALATSPAIAIEKPAIGTWQSSAEIGFVATSGNTETETLNAKAATATERERWRHKLDAAILNASDNGETTAERYNINGQSDYKLADPAFLFVTIAYEKDRFSGFDYQVSEAVGYGRRVIDTEHVSLELEIGPGARQTKLDNGETDNEGLIRGAARLAWIVSESSKFGEKLTVEAGEDVTITRSETSLSSKVNGNLSMKLSLIIKHTSEVPAGVDKTDSETGVTLVYSF